VGAKLYADTTTKTLIVTQAPDGDGKITIDAQVDVWSDLEEDWASTLALRRFTFPLIAIGGQTISAGKLGTTYVLLDPWQIAPYEADHDLIIDGNLFTESALVKLVKPTVGAYTVSAIRNLSTLVEVVEAGTSGLTAEESAQLEAIAKYSTNKVELSADRTTVTIYDDDGVTPFKVFNLTNDLRTRTPQ
jgi:hypothetical protein